jgi:hypothetical protein
VRLVRSARLALPAGQRPDIAAFLAAARGSGRRVTIVELRRAAIRVEHLAPREPGLRLTLPHTKGERTGASVTVAIPYGTTELCPIRALRRWQAAADITAGAMFRRIWTPPRGRDGRNTPCPGVATPPSTPAPSPVSFRPAPPPPVLIPRRLAATASNAAR